MWQTHILAVVERHVCERFCAVSLLHALPHAVVVHLPFLKNKKELMLKRSVVNYYNILKTEMSIKVVRHIEMPKAVPKKSICPFQKL